MEAIEYRECYDTYELKDEESGRMIYIRIYRGHYGPYLDIFRSKPEENQVPDAALHLDFFDKKVRYRIWDDGSQEKDDPDRIIEVFTL